MSEKYPLNEEAARRLLNTAGQSTVVDRIVPLTAGAVGSLYIIERYAEPDLVVKVYPATAADRMRTEAYVYRLLGAASIPVPHVIAAVDADGALPRPYLLMNRLDGVRLADVQAQLSMSQLTAIYRQMGLALRQIHGHRFDECGLIVGGSLCAEGSNADFIGRQFTRRIADFNALGGNAHVAERLRRYAQDQHRVLQHCNGGALCHNDFLAGNVLVIQDSDGWLLSGVLDVERALVADPLFDLARITKDGGRPAKAFADAHGVEGTLARERLAYYELYQVLELWNWFAETTWLEQLPALEEQLLWRLS